MFSCIVTKLTRTKLINKNILLDQQQIIKKMSTTMNKKYIATHDATFHCDEVTACYILKQLPTYKDHDIVRTRKQELLDGADIVADVGGVFDAGKRRFDHHQRSFNLTIKDFHPIIKSTNPKNPIRLSSAGLIYAHYGKDFIKEVLQMTTNDDINSQNGDKDNFCKRTASDMNDKNMVEAIYEKLYGSFMEEIDAIDNGVELAQSNDDTIPVYNYNLSTHLAARIGRLNPDADTSDEEKLEQFQIAMSVVGKELTECLQHLATRWWPSLMRLKECILNRHNVDESGAILQLPPAEKTSWKSTLPLLEEQLSIVGQIKFIIYDNPIDAARWRIMCVPITPHSFQSRLPLKEEWRGIREGDLQKISGITDASFVHVSGFTGGALSREGCLALARKTLETCEKD